MISRFGQSVATPCETPNSRRRMATGRREEESRREDGRREDGRGESVYNSRPMPLSCAPADSAGSFPAERALLNRSSRPPRGGCDSSQLTQPAHSSATQPTHSSATQPTHSSATQSAHSSATQPAHSSATRSSQTPAFGFEHVI